VGDPRADRPEAA